MLGSNLYLLRTTTIHCPVCHARMFVGDLVGDLVGIDDPVCQSCFWYFMPL